MCNKFDFSVEVTFFDDNYICFDVQASDMHEAYHEATKFLLNIERDIADTDYLLISYHV